MLILCERSYVKRLWCIIVVSVFIEMGGAPEQLDVQMLDEGKFSMAVAGHASINSATGTVSVGPSKSVTGTTSILVPIIAEEMWKALHKFDICNATRFAADTDCLLSIVDGGCG